MGIQEDSQQLRRLARAVMAGDLLPEEYRRQRRVVIDRYAGDGPVSGQPLAAAGVPVVQTQVEHTLPNGRGAPTVPYSRDSDDITVMGGDARTIPGAGRGGPAAPDEQPESGVRDLLIGVAAVALVVGIVAGLLAYLM